MEPPDCLQLARAGELGLQVMQDGLPNNTNLAMSNPRDGYDYYTLTSPEKPVDKGSLIFSWRRDDADCPVDVQWIPPATSEARSMEFEWFDESLQFLYNVTTHSSYSVSVVRDVARKMWDHLMKWEWTVHGRIVNGTAEMRTDA